MDRNFKSRLQRIRETGSSLSAVKAKPLRLNEEAANGNDLSSWPGWASPAHKTLKRTFSVHLSFSIPHALQNSLALLVPDILSMGQIPQVEQLLFFDLETTGLSGGAGTIAFLAAFGRFTHKGNNPAQLEITQYLLLDYPGEEEFIKRVVGEFAPLKKPGGNKADEPMLPLVISYNGKCFDAQILRNRCLMNGIMNPKFFHADLLHPARRLWKNKLPDCSQPTIESSILGLDRTGDVSGALAPDIWFSYLRSGLNGDLLTVCEHNAKDIKGLAAIFIALAGIASDPHGSLEKYSCDEEELAVSWIKGIRKNPFSFGEGEKKTGESLLRYAAGKGYSRASYMLALDLLKRGNGSEGRAILQAIIRDISGDSSTNPGSIKKPLTVPSTLKAAALRSLAIDAEWNLKDVLLAIKYTASALAIMDLPGKARHDFEKRQSRLKGKAS